MSETAITYELHFIARDRTKRLRFGGVDAGWDWGDVFKSACKLIDVAPPVESFSGVKRATFALPALAWIEAVGVMAERGLLPLRCKAALLDEAAETDVLSAPPAPLWQQMENAIYHGKVEEVQRLLDAGVEPNYVNKLGVSLLSSAAARGNLDVLGRLFVAGALPNLDEHQPLILALHEGHWEAARFLVDKGVDPRRGIRDFGTSLMHLMVFREPPLEAIDFLVDHGVDVNGADRAGQTPLAHARERGWARIAALLVERGARD